MSVDVEFARVATPNEDSIVAVNAYRKKISTQIKSDGCSILLRSSYGTAGIKTKVGVNYFKYNVVGLKLYSYRVDLEVDYNIKTKLTIKQAVERYLLDMELYKSKITDLLPRFQPFVLQNTITY